MQQDSFNCGILAVNYIKRHAFAVALAGSSDGHLAMRRLQDFCQFGEHIISRVRTLQHFDTCILTDSHIDRIR